MVEVRQTIGKCTGQTAIVTPTSFSLLGHYGELNSPKVCTEDDMTEENFSPSSLSSINEIFNLQETKLQSDSLTTTICGHELRYHSMLFDHGIVLEDVKNSVVESHPCPQFVTPVIHHDNVVLENVSTSVVGTRLHPQFVSPLVLHNKGNLNEDFPSTFVEARLPPQFVISPPPLAYTDYASYDSSNSSCNSMQTIGMQNEMLDTPYIETVPDPRAYFTMFHPAAYTHHNAYRAEFSETTKPNAQRKTMSAYDKHTLISRLNNKVTARPQIPCHICGSSSTNHKRHMMTHTGEKPYSCPYCPYKATQKNNIAVHIAHIHSEARPFKCLHCDYTGKSATALRHHVNYTHKNKGAMRRKREREILQASNEPALNLTVNRRQSWT